MEFVFPKKKKLAPEELTAVWRLGRALKTDSSFDLVCGKDFDYFIDYEDDDGGTMSLVEGLKLLSEAISYELEHDISHEDAEIIRSLMRKFVDPEWKD